MQIIQKYEPDDALRRHNLLGYNGFRRLLLSREWGHTMKQEYQQIRDNMNYPLHQYFVNSSHNT